MNTLAHSLHEYAAAMLRAIADVNGIDLTSNAKRAMIDQLVSTLSDSAQLRAILAACSAPARQAVDDLLRAGGALPWPAFERRYGSIRLLGPGRIERERPQRAPASVAEELWYRGLVFRAFAQTADGLVEFLYLPTDLVERLPKPTPSSTARLQVAAAAPATQIEPADDHFLHDLVTVLCLIQADRVRLTTPNQPLTWHTTTLYELNTLLLRPAPRGIALTPNEPGTAGALAICLAHDLGWLRGDRHRLRLQAAPVRAWLAAERSQQQRAVLDAWRTSATWNDLCRTPELYCAETGNWSNDPVGTRARLLPLLAQLEPEPWRRIDDLVAAIQRAAPDFQRPDGDYDTWYVRRRAEQKFLRGFASWDAVEGALLRFILQGPLHWLGAVEVGESRFHFTPAGHAWLIGAPPPAQPAPGRISVQPDFSVVVPGDAPLQERFRVARFTTWQPGGPPFRYRITQQGLRRAAAQGVGVAKVLDYLRAQCGADLPPNVAHALARWQPAAVPATR